MSAWRNREEFKSRVLEWAAKLDVKATGLYVRPMRQKWASSSTAGTLSFNDELLELEQELGDYVIVHELLHFSVPNHGKLWKALMRAHLGDWERLQEQLNLAGEKMAASRGGDRSHLTEAEASRTHAEKLQALVVDPCFPVAVRSLAILKSVIGDWDPIPGVEPRDAVKLSEIRHPVLTNFTDTTSHLWVRPGFPGYRAAWKAAGLKVPDGAYRHLDHVHAEELAGKQGYGYVLLLDVSCGPNMSAGSTERKLSTGATASTARKQPVFHATEVHWAKLWDLNQLRPGQLTKETMGGRKTKEG